MSEQVNFELSLYIELRKCLHMKRTSIAATSETLISILQTNLKDRYKSGFPVLKELIQNADDAGAKVLYLGYAPASPAPDGHPLLSGPALFAVNDGSFDTDNDRAIRQFGISSKSDDVAAIGKFGLGMKSVFHFSEVVYYHAKCDALPGNENEGVGKGECADRLNPWYSDDIDTPLLREKWDDFTEEQRRWLRERLGDLLPVKQHFLLWIPLRLTSHADEENPPIINREFDSYSGPGCNEDPIFEPGYVEQIAGLIPMLHALEVIEVWRLDANKRASRHASVRLRIGGSADRRCLPPDDLKKEASGKQRLRGEVEVVESASRPSHVFGGMARILDTERIAQLNKSNKWPRNFRRDGRSRVHVREKAPPHVGVCWRRWAAEGEAKLDCSWAVFLPLSEKPEVISLTGEWNYSLQMHGWFFVDAGRNLFELSERAAGGEPSDEPTLRHEWNRELKTAGTLPLIPEALREFQSRARVSNEEMRQIVEGLTRTDLFCKNRDAICSSWQWAYRWQPDGATWELIESAATFVDLPESKKSFSPADALPGLREAAGRLVLTPSRWPRLSSQKHHGAWPEKELTTVLASAEPERLLADTRGLEYVVEFCEQTRPEPMSMTTLLRLLLARPLDDVGAQEKLLKRLVLHVHAKQRLRIPVRDDPAGRELWKKLENLSLTVLLVPQGCEPDKATSSATLPLVDGASIMQAIAVSEGETVTAAAEDLRGQLAQVVMERTDPTERRKLLDQCANLRVFRISEAGHEKERPALLTWAALDARYLRGVVFRNTERSGAIFLRKVLPNEPITLLTKDLSELLYGTNKVPVCDADGCGNVILRQTNSSAMAAVDCRGDLLDFFLKSPPSNDVSAYRRAVAVLLHGQVPVPHGQPALLVDGSGDPIWARITNDVLARQGDSWRLVDHRLSSQVPENRRQEYSLSAVDRGSVVRLLEEQASREGPDGVPLNLTTAQREDLLGMLHFADKSELIKRLRIHAEYVNEQAAASDPLRAITDHCFWNEGFALPSEFRPHVTLLRLSDNANLWPAQKCLARVWDERAATEIILKRLHPADHWGILLGSLGRSNEWPDELLSNLQNTAWLPRADRGVAVCPCDVIHLPQIRNTVNRALATATTKSFVDSQDLSEQVHNHKNFAILARKLFPSKRQALEILGEVLGEDETFHVGLSERLIQPKGLTRFLAVFANAPDRVMRAAAVVSEVEREYGRDECVNALLKPLCRPLSVERLTRILAFLSFRHEEIQGSIELRAEVAEVYNWYLRELVAHAQSFRDALTGFAPLRLLSRSSHWKNAAELCLGAEDIDADYRLDEQQRIIVESSLTQRATAAPSERIASAPVARSARDWNDGRDKAAQELKTYFKPWLEYRPGMQVVIGGFVAILGGNPAFEQLAQHYLGNNYTVANIRKRIRLPKDQYGRVSEEQVIQYLVVVECEKGQNITVNNLCGQEITVPLSKKIEDLFVYHSPASPFERRHNTQKELKSYRVVRLREFNPASVGDQGLIDLLRKAAGKIVAEFYNQRLGTGLDELFKGLEKDDIYQIRVVETYLLDHAPVSLGQFGLFVQPRLRDLLRRMDQVHRLQAEENVIADASHAAVERRSDEQRRQVQLEFRKALDDSAVCDALLDAVRRKINGHHQYSESSVPFELLQNADDACVEFERFGGVSDNWFSIACAERSLAFLHAGRPINMAASGDVSLPESGFHRDLEKMLMLSTSDKQTGDEASTVTGKFGLGFKSVYLICDRPRAVSSGLGFEVVGAFLPRPLAGNYRQELEKQYRAVTGHDIRDDQGTIFSLALRQDAKPETTLNRFRRLLPVLLVFTQRIRKCHLHGLFHEQKTTEWSEEALLHAEGWAFGLLDSPDPDSLLKKQHAAVLRLGDKKALLLGLGLKGFTTLPDEIPSLWVTAPTSHEEKLGVALNAPFTLDIGRSQLGTADIKAHYALADELGIATGAALLRLFDATTAHWDDVRIALHLRDDTKSADLWQSLWRMLGEIMAHRARHSDSEAFKLLKRVFWGGTTHGLAHLYEQRAALPTGLDAGTHNIMTKRCQIVSRLMGCLDEDEALTLFKLAADWPKVKERLVPGTIVSGSRIWNVLEQLGVVDERQATPVDLAQLISWELEVDDVVSPERSTTFGAVIRPGLLQRLESTSSGLPEARRVREMLKVARFRSRKNEEVPADRLLVAMATTADKRDETLRAAFAPDNRLLAEAYTETTIGFFLVCRGPMAARIEDMAEWALVADTDMRKSAVLRYLLRGELRDGLTDCLRSQFKTLPDNHWLKKLPDSQLLRGFSHRERRMLLLLLDLLPDDAVQPQGPLPLDARREKPAPLDPATALANIYDWWSEHREQKVTDYESRVYPKGWPDIRQEVEWSDISQRKAWLTLFLLASCHTLGRMKFHRDRTFVQLCDQLQIQDRLAEAEVDPAGWLLRVEEYLESKPHWVKYYHWLKLLPGIFFVARKLAHYGDGFLQAEKINHAFSLDHIISPNESEYLNFTGPSLQRVLGMGACFIMRECSRKNVILNPHAHPHCYVPHGKVRRLFEELGCPGMTTREVNPAVYSRQIYEFLCDHLGAEKATFEHCFDLPFLTLAYSQRRKRKRNRKLHMRLFGRELNLDPKVSEVGRWVTGPHGAYPLW